MLALKAERDVQATVLEAFKRPGGEESQSPRTARGSIWTKRSVEPISLNFVSVRTIKGRSSSDFESSVEKSPPRRLARRLGKASLEWQEGSRKTLLAQS
jgi:hypothetical protein